MKKSIVLAVLGGTLAAASSYAQGVINFSSYLATPFGSVTTFLVGGTPVPDGFSAQLYYALGTVSDPVTSGNASSILSSISGAFVAVGSPQLYNTTVASAGAYPGYFGGNNVIIPTYTSGSITFEVLTTGTVGGINYQGRSGSFTMASIPAAALPAINMTGMPAWQVAAVVPEPTTLALAGLGGLASLLVMRRKNA